MCRLEKQNNRQTTIGIHKIFLDQFIASFDKPPKELILDFDATDDLTHGKQERTFYHGYYRHYCFLPLYVFCTRQASIKMNDDQMLVSYLRPSNIDGAKHSAAILKLLVTALRKVWPDVKIIFRGDGGFCRQSIIRWCERHTVSYIIGYSKNKRLMKIIETTLEKTKANFELTKEKQRDFMDFNYAAKTWNIKRRIVAKLEVTDKGQILS